ncbi:MAG: amidase [Dehalococcoidia bacterium]
MDATGIAEAVRSRRRSARSAVEEVYSQIDAWEPTIRAWQHLARESALAEADAIDRALAAGAPVGALAGVPIGIKDIIDVAGMPTTNGVPGGRTADLDAFAVARLRAAGAIVVGKTVTASFAFVDPPVTRNPYDPTRTPGGSSSGSGAAVGARTVPVALGTQTAGSVLRPASYCGAVGFKPTFGWTGRTGVTPLSPSLDHVGIICRSVRDAALFFDLMAAEDPDDPSTRTVRPEGRRLLGLPEQPPRIGVVEATFDLTDAETTLHTRQTLAVLEAAGAMLVPVVLPVAQMFAAQRVIMWTEAAAVHRDLTKFAEGLPTPMLRDNLRIGSLIPGDFYLRADRLRRRHRLAVADAMRGLDALALPSTTTPAGAPATTGDRLLLAPWSLLGTPAISIPSGLSAEGLPLGLQLVGRRGADGDLLRVAAWAERRLQPILPPAR